MRRIVYILFSVLVVCHGAARAQQKRPVMAFASDTQEPMWVEKIFLKSDHNLEATQMIFKEVSERRPKAFFILGDVVSSGKKPGAWKNIDLYLGKAAKDSVPVFATLGNHDVMFNAQKGMRNFKTRFPTYEPTGYTVITDSVAVVLLNSNFGALSTEDITKQNAWYKQKLKDLDADASIKLVIVGCHHSPYTNSKIVKPSPLVQQYFVEPFLASAKCTLFISGHSHNYEQFKVKGKDFVVIGGGGGLHQDVRANNDVMHDVAADYKPIFHYLEVTRQGNKLEVLSRKLASDFKSFADGRKFEVK